MTKSKQEEIIYLLNRYKLCGIEYIEPININKIDIDKNNLPNELKQLKSYVDHCNICELSKFKSNSIYSMGDLDSEVMIIGINYDYFNVNINKIVKSIIENVLLIDFNKVYITNILKCNKNININILDKQIELCKDYLDKQIELIKPKLIITFGLSYNYLMKSDDNIFDISGNLYNYNNIKLIPLLDLEFIYKNPSYKQDMFIDLKKIKTVLE